MFCGTWEDNESQQKTRFSVFGVQQVIKDFRKYRGIKYFFQIIYAIDRATYEDLLPFIVMLSYITSLLRHFLVFFTSTNGT